MNTERIIPRKEFRELTGICRTQEWQLTKENKLPPTVKIGSRVLGYRESDYHVWLKQLTAAA